MALDFDAINKNLFGDDARTLTWPVGYYDEYKDAYLGLDDPEMPASVKELYSNNPTKAKQLLAEAGFPNGFKATIVIRQDAVIVDYYSMLQAMWANIGINVNLDIKEYAVYMSVLRGRAYEQMEYGTYSPIANLYSCTAYSGTTQTNSSYVPTDPVVEKAKAQMQALAVTDTGKADKIHKELMKYVLDQAWAIPYPAPANYTLWWPWLKNYPGITSVGYINEPNWAQFAWVDQNLKKNLTR
jgi:peptide/nickel transport system substrate-binding protein